MPNSSLPSKPNSRRKFLRASLATTVAAAAYPTLGTSPALAESSAPSDFELDELAIDDLQKLAESGDALAKHLASQWEYPLGWMGEFRASRLWRRLV